MALSREPTVALKLYDPKRHVKVILRSFRKQGINRYREQIHKEQKTRQHTWGLKFLITLTAV